MFERVIQHHKLEAKLRDLRLLRDLGNPAFKEEEENDLLDKMEVLWYQMDNEEREILERERSARQVPSTEFPMVDVSIEKWRQGLPPRISKPSQDCHLDSGESTPWSVRA